MTTARSKSKSTINNAVAIDSENPLAKPFAGGNGISDDLDRAPPVEVLVDCAEPRWVI